MHITSSGSCTWFPDQHMYNNQYLAIKDGKLYTYGHTVNTLCPMDPMRTRGAVDWGQCLG